MHENAIRQLNDRQAITDVLVAYCRALDCMDLAAVSALFTSDCHVEYGPDARLQSLGAEALAKSLERMWRWSRTSHHLSNVLIDFDTADIARATSYVMAWHERHDKSTATIYGQYVDRLVRDQGAWRIAERSMVMNGCDAGFTVDIHPLRRNPKPVGCVAPDIDRPRST